MCLCNSHVCLSNSHYVLLEHEDPKFYLFLSLWDKISVLWRSNKYNCFALMHPLDMCNFSCDKVSISDNHRAVLGLNTWQSKPTKCTNMIYVTKVLSAYTYVETYVHTYQCCITLRGITRCKEMIILSLGPACACNHHELINHQQ